MASETHELPVRSAGGGKPSEITSRARIDGFQPNVLKHLIFIAKTIPRDHPFQDDVQVHDEPSFLSYMASSGSSVLSPPRFRDLSYPLSSYYISSSHNTYLSGHQLYGEASTQAYTNVLQRGCRCLEIDVWDGEEDSDVDTNSDEEGTKTGHRERSNSQHSRWDKMKAKAVNRMGASSSGNHQSGAGSHLAAAIHRRHADGVSDSQSSVTHLSSQTSPATQPLKPEPRVLHGYTLTQSVTFRAVCHAISESAFAASDLPLIVSLEVHASLAQQETMVEIMKEAWGNHLVDITQSSESEIEALPTPDALRNKILIKVKWTADSQTGESNNPIEHVVSGTSEGDHEENLSSVRTTSATQKKASKLIAALSQLGVYTRAYTFKQFSQPEASIPTHVFSLSEGKVRDMHSDPLHGPALFNHNINYLMRVFPRGTRIGSSNVDPTFHWRQGAQMVALNWQKLDKGMMLNEGMFAGQEGWVLKPEGYRALRAGTDKTKAEATSMIKKYILDLDLQLFAAQNLPLPLEKEPSHLQKMKPYVKVQLHTDIHGPPGRGKSTSGSAQAESDVPVSDEKEASRYKHESKTARTDSPDFEGETLSWPNVPDVVDELSFIRSVVGRTNLPQAELLLVSPIGHRSVAKGVFILFSTWRHSAGLFGIERARLPFPS